MAGALGTWALCTSPVARWSAVLTPRTSSPCLCPRPRLPRRSLERRQVLVLVIEINPKIEDEDDDENENDLDHLPNGWGFLFNMMKAPASTRTSTANAINVATAFNTFAC